MPGGLGGLLSDGGSYPDWTKPLRGRKKHHNSVYLSVLPNSGHHKTNMEAYHEKN